VTVLRSNKLIREFRRIEAELPDFGRDVEAAHLLNYFDVLEAHFCIADFFLEEDYGIGGIGPRSVDVLISTVERQWTGFEGFTIYDSEFERIASLMFGIIKNHPFYDANKRTAFLCALLQLHRMGRVLTIPQVDFENLMVEIADGKIYRRAMIKDLTRRKFAHPELKFIGRYLEKNSRRTTRLRKAIKFRELRTLIGRFGFSFDSAFKGSINIVKLEDRIVHRFWRGDKIEQEKIVIGNIAYHGEGVDVPDSTIKLVRQLCGITDQDGFDNDVILRDAQPTFQLIKSYRDSLQRLAYR